MKKDIKKIERELKLLIPALTDEQLDNLIEDLKKIVANEKEQRDVDTYLNEVF